MSKSQCTGCSHIINGSVRHCPMCGSTMKIVRESNERNCPRCRHPLEIHQYNKYQLDRCTNCEGLWVEPEKFTVLTSEFDVYRDETSDPNYIKKPTPKAEAYLPCACCEKLMTRKNFKAISGVIIDSCIHCGIWLDKGELKQIRSFVASGGLDKAQDRNIERNKDNIDVLNDRVSDLEMMEKMLNKFSPKRIFFRGF
ncbi:zf-TFIIB domain-containing protein [Litorilituus lipolyticus]|nr:zf-TFIIB domain-containing protein [Litorilituus lipolyticus]